MNPITNLTMKLKNGLLAILGFCLLSTSVATAQDTPPGIDELNQATILKLTARNLADLGKVADLCEQAIEKGLKGDNKEFALQLFTSALKQRADNAAAAIFAARPHPQWRNLRKFALTDLERAVELDPSFASGHLLIAKLQALPGGDAEAVKAAIDAAVKGAKHDKLKAKALVARVVIQKEEKAQLTDLNEAVKIAPDFPDAIRARGVYYFSKKKFKKSLADLNKAVKLLPSHAATHEAKGLTLMMMDKTAEAKKSFSEAIKLNPKATGALTSRARLFAIQKKYDKAIEDLNIALKVNPDSLPARLLRAQVYQIEKKYQEALKDVDYILRRRGLVRAIEMRAGILAAMGKIDEAINQMERITEQAPDNADLLFTLGTLYTEKRLYDKALTAYEASISADKKNWMAVRARADLLLNIGRQKEALAGYDKAIKMQPKNSGLLNNLAWLLATSPDKTIRDGKRSIELGKKACELTKYDKPHIISTLAAGYAETGDFDTAKKWSTKALELGKKQKLEKELIDALKEELKNYQEKKPTRELKKPESPKKEPDFNEAV